MATATTRDACPECGKAMAYDIRRDEFICSAHGRFLCPECKAPLHYDCLRDDYACRNVHRFHAYNVWHEKTLRARRDTRKLMDELTHAATGAIYMALWIGVIWLVGWIVWRLL